MIEHLKVILKAIYLLDEEKKETQYNNLQNIFKKIIPLLNDIKVDDRKEFETDFIIIHSMLSEIDNLTDYMKYFKPQNIIDAEEELKGAKEELKGAKEELSRVKKEIVEVKDNSNQKHHNVVKKLEIDAQKTVRAAEEDAEEKVRAAKEEAEKKVKAAEKKVKAAEEKLKLRKKMRRKKLHKLKMLILKLVTKVKADRAKETIRELEAKNNTLKAKNSRLETYTQENKRVIDELNATIDELSATIDELSATIQDLEKELEMSTHKSYDDPLNKYTREIT